MNMYFHPCVSLLLSRRNQIRNVSQSPAELNVIMTVSIVKHCATVVGPHQAGAEYMLIMMISMAGMGW